MLTIQIARFATELSAFVDILPPARADLATPLATLARSLPSLARGEPRVRREGQLAEALGRTAGLLAATRREGAAPQRLVTGLESRLKRLFEVGAGLPAHQQRPRPAPLRPTRSLRGPRPMVAVPAVAFG